MGRENPSTKDIPGFWCVAARDKKIPLHFVRRDFVSLAILYFCLVRCQIKNEPGANHYSYGPVAAKEKFFASFFQKAGPLRALSLPILPDSGRCHVKILRFVLSKGRAPTSTELAHFTGFRSLPRKSSLLLSFKKEEKKDRPFWGRPFSLALFEKEVTPPAPG